MKRLHPHSLRTILAVAVLMCLNAGTPGVLAGQHGGTEDPYENVGKAKFWRRCDVGRHALNPDNCEGFASFNLFDPSKAFVAGEWIASREWDKNVTSTIRPGGGRMTIRTIEHPRRVPLRNLNRRGLVLAHIGYDPEGPADERFRIGGSHTAGRQFTGDFYIVMGLFRKGDKTSNGMRIAHWRLFGLRANGEFRALRANGILRWCPMAEEPSDERVGALFVDSCVDRHTMDGFAKLYGAANVTRLFEVEANQVPNQQGLLPSKPQQITSADSTTIIAIARRSRNAFASLPCGMGCCVGESAPDMPEGSFDGAGVSLSSEIGPRIPTPRARVKSLRTFLGQ